MENGVPDSVEDIVAAWGRERPEDDVSSIRVVTPIWRLAAELRRTREDTLAALGLDQSRLDVLGTLRRAGPPYRLSAGELTRRCRVSPGATTQRVDRLERDGYVERLQGDDDRRVVHVALTADGSLRLDSVFAAVISADEAVLGPVSRADRKALERILGTWLRRAGLDRTSPG